MNDFNKDMPWQLEIRNSVIAGQLYDKVSHEGRYVFLDKGKISDILQRKYAVDTILQAKNGKAVGIEEKIVRWKGYPYRHLCIETESCTNEGFESEGWIHYGKADYLLYCFQQEDESLICWLIDFAKLQDYYHENKDRLKPFQMEERNRTRGVLAPLHEIKNITLKIYHLNEPIPF